MSSSIDPGRVITVLESLGWRRIVGGATHAFYRPDGFYVWMPREVMWHIDDFKWWLSVNGVDVEALDRFTNPI